MMFLILLSGCQLQINLGSSVVNVPVVKFQISEGDSDMLTESKLADITNDQKSKLDAKAK